MTNYNSTSVSAIDTAARKVVATVAVGRDPVDVAITPNGAFAFVTNEADNTVSVIATATNTVVDTVQWVTALPEGFAIRQNVIGKNCR